MSGIKMEKFEFNYGLMVLDKRDAELDNIPILHFCGYAKEPTEQDAKHLYEELATDKEFGLTEIIGHLEIYPAPPDIVQRFKDDYNEDMNDQG